MFKQRVLILLIILAICSNKRIVDEFNAIRFGSEGWKLITRHAVHNNELIDIRFNLSLVNNKTYNRPSKPVQFSLDIYYGRQKLKRIDGLSCQERKEQADLVFNIPPPTLRSMIKQNKIFEISYRKVFRVDSEHKMMYLAMSECSDRFILSHLEGIIGDYLMIHLEINELQPDPEYQYLLIYFVCNLVYFVVMNRWQCRYISQSLFFRNSFWYLKWIGIGQMLRIGLQICQYCYSHCVWTMEIYELFQGVFAVLINCLFQLMFLYLSWGQDIKKVEYPRKDILQQLLFFVCKLYMLIFLI